MKVVAGSDWSVGLNHGATSLSDAKLLERIGRELRSTYEGIVEEPMPAQFASILDRLDAREPPSDGS